MPAQAPSRPGPIHLRGRVLPEGEQRDVYVVDGRITFESVRGARTLAANGWLLPGLVDAHAHLALASPLARGSTAQKVRASARAQLDAGVLLIREPGGPDRSSAAVGVAEGLPRVVSAGRFLAPPGGYIPGLAREVGRPRAVRAAAQALRWNPVPIVIPCHRVVGTSGALTGYAGGTTERKQKLLAIEGIPMVKAGRDFRIRRDAMYVLAPGDTEYCLPTCPSVDPFPLGGVLSGSRARAEATGLAPCTTCRPDLHPLPVASSA